jgi:hypothetical protein
VTQQFWDGIGGSAGEDRFRAEVTKQKDERLNEGLLWVGRKPYPALLEKVHIDDPLWEIRRAVLASETPVTLSIIWGSGTYSDNYHHGLVEQDFTEDPELVEVGVVGDGRLLADPLPRQTTAQVLELIRLTQEGRWPSG